jgi:hypothetical protein
MAMVNRLAWVLSPILTSQKLGSIYPVLKVSPLGVGLIEKYVNRPQEGRRFTLVRRGVAHQEGIFKETFVCILNSKIPEF